ncbi:MAG: DUF5011 domain-containing protein, partial [Candidatus Parcubacteria bacterium]|nr:DUF5011 domain-containing protein [Candidatus Parcubacteria bacterium]
MKTVQGAISFPLRDKIFSRAIFLGITAAFVVGGFFVANFALAADTAVLGVTQISAVQTFATADGTFTNGWRWVFDVTVPTSETILKMKFADWISGSNSIPAGSNIQFYSTQSSNASDAAHAVAITAANNYSGEMDLINNSSSDLNSTQAGRQIQVTVEARVPVGSAGGSYSTSYGIKSLPDTTAPVITLLGITPMTIEGGSIYTDAGATALDNVDGNVTLLIAVVGLPVNTSILGSHTITYDVSDSVGNPATQVTRTVNVVDIAAEAAAETAVVAYESAPISTLEEVAAAEALKAPA